MAWVKGRPRRLEGVQQITLHGDVALSLIAQRRGHGSPMALLSALLSAAGVNGCGWVTVTERAFAGENHSLSRVLLLELSVDGWMTDFVIITKRVSR